MWCLCFLISCLGCHSFPSKEQESFNFMSAATVCSDFGAQENKVCHYFHFFPFYLPLSNERYCHDISFFKKKLVLRRLFHFPPSPSSRSSLVPLHFLPLECYLRLLMFLLPILIPACNSSSLAFLMMCSADRLNKQGDSRQPCHTPFSILSQSFVGYRVLLLLDPHTGFSGDR